MKNEYIESFQSSIKEKLGDENISLIADDLATLIINNQNVNETLKNYENEIKSLKETKETLINANGKLLQQIPMEKEEKEEKEEKKSNFSFKDMFDEKGNFKK